MITAQEARDRMCSDEEVLAFAKQEIAPKIEGAVQRGNRVISVSSIPEKLGSKLCSILTDMGYVVGISKSFRDGITFHISW